jgi:hypothetical protein
VAEDEPTFAQAVCSESLARRDWGPPLRRDAPAPGPGARNPADPLTRRRGRARAGCRDVADWPGPAAATGIPTRRVSRSCFQVRVSAGARRTVPRGVAVIRAGWAANRRLAAWQRSGSPAFRMGATAPPQGPGGPGGGGIRVPPCANMFVARAGSEFSIWNLALP